MLKGMPGRHPNPHLNFHCLAMIHCTNKYGLGILLEPLRSVSQYRFGCELIYKISVWW